MAGPEMVIESNLLVMNGYSVAKGIGVGKYISSDAFTVGGYEWKICIYPDGVSPEYSTHVAMFVALSTELTEGRFVQAMFELTLMDQSGNGKHRANTCFGRPLPQTISSRWGYKRYFKRDALEKSDYLRDDCLKIYCTVGVVSSAKKMAEMPDRMLKQNSPRHSCSVTEMTSGSNLFLIQGYSTMKSIGVRNFIASDKFTAGGCEWEIHFYPNGKIPEDSSPYVSVFVSLVSKVMDVQALLEITLMDQSGKGKHKVHSCFNKTLPTTLKWSGCKWGYMRFFKKATLEMSDYLRDDCLKIYCTVGVVSAIDCSRRSIKVPDSDIGSHIGMLLDAMVDCDVTFNVSGEKLYAHKLILAARSPKLQSEFVEGADTEEVMVPDMESEVFKALLHFIYKDALAENEVIPSVLRIADTLTAKLMAAADRFDLGRLKRLCESHLCKYINADSVMQVLVLAESCHAAELKDVCLKFAAKNLAAIMRSDGFKYLEEKYPSLKCELLNTVGDEDCGTGDGSELRKIKQKASAEL